MIQRSTHVKEDFKYIFSWHTKAFKKSKTWKAAGPDTLKPILLIELREESAPNIQVIFSNRHHPIFKNMKNIA